MVLINNKVRMTNKITNLVNKCSLLEPLDGRVLIHPLKLRNYESVGSEPDYAKAKAEGINPQEDEMPMKKMVHTINRLYQEAIVLQIAKNEPRLHIGDRVVYKVSNLLDFDLIPGVSVLKNFEIIAIKHIPDESAILTVV
jgi:hypothetical protein